MTDLTSRLERANLNVIRYWRSCVADSTMANPPKADKCIALSSDELLTGLLEQPTLDRIRSKVGQSGDPPVEISVYFFPLIYRCNRFSHTRWQPGQPSEFFPIVIDARIWSEDGVEARIIPSRTMIPRSLLEPLSFGSFSVGTVEEQDRFLKEFPFEKPGTFEPYEELWARYRKHYMELFERVVGEWRSNDKDYLCGEQQGYLIPSSGSDAITKSILHLYDSILHDKDSSFPLLKTFSTTQRSPLSPVLRAPYQMAHQPGHGTGRFPLADRQRDVLAHLAVAEEGEILAVNGPPGTGKTAMILSAVAGEWVRAARAAVEPPVIVAASSNNQAIKNILEAFAGDLDDGADNHCFSGRWLPDLTTYGLYFPAKRKEEGAREEYLTERQFSASYENKEYVDRAMSAYLDAAKAALPELEDATLDNVVAALHQRIETEVRKLEEFDTTRRSLADARETIKIVLDTDPDGAIEALEECRRVRVRAMDDSRACQSILGQWDNYLGREPVFHVLFSFLPPVRQRRLARARSFLRKIGW